MKIKQIDFLIQNGKFSHSPEVETILTETRSAVMAVVWPENSDGFTLYPKRQANGVVPIKKNFMDFLIQHHWIPEHRMAIASRIKPGPIDAVKKLSTGQYFAVEWETGNISSSHRAINKMAVGMLDGILCGGVLILPSREMYQYLTDRIGNYAEIEPYFPVWRNLSIENGVLAVIEVEHDGISFEVPPIKKGTDGRALR